MIRFARWSLWTCVVCFAMGAWADQGSISTVEEDGAKLCGGVVERASWATADAAFLPGVTYQPLGGPRDCECWPACVCGAACRWGGPGQSICGCYQDEGAQCCTNCNEWWIVCGCV